MRARDGLLMAATLCLIVATTLGAETPFPQEITAPEAKVVVYQPQPEKLEGNVLTGRAAMSILPTGRKEPIFGAFWFSSLIDTDQEQGRAQPARAACAAGCGRLVAWAARR
jgi:hypothetical protein